MTFLPLRSALLLAAGALVMGAAPAPSRVYEAPAFGASPGELLEEAASAPAPEGADIEVLLQEAQISFDGEGRRTVTNRLIYRPLAESGVRRWGFTGMSWAPWHEERPEVRARVVLPDGRELELDPKTVVESADSAPTADAVTDRRTVRGPLPGIAVGAVVEEQIRVREHRPFFQAGSVSSFGLTPSAPARRVRVIVDAPTSLGARTKVRGIRLPPKKTVEGERTRLVFERLDVRPVSGEALLPPDVIRHANVAVTTGKSWQAIAEAYGAIVDEQLRGTRFEEKARALVGEARGLEAAGRLLAHVHAATRYTGAELGEAAIVPRSPEETLTRQYGDCKDLSALLVAYLRAAGIPAQVALLNTAFDADPDLAGLGEFNHAVVYVPGPPAFWIDPSDPDAPAGELPSACQGKLALVTGPGTTKLVRTPEARPLDNQSLITREFFLSELGLAKVRETREGRGAFANRMRAMFRASGKEGVQQSESDYARDILMAERIGEVEITDPLDFSTPPRLSFEAQESKRGITDETEALVVVVPSAIFGWLPKLLLPPDEKEAPHETRVTDLWLDEPYVAEMRYRIVPPPGLALRQLPASGKEKLGPGIYTWQYEVNAAGEVLATFRFDTVKRRLGPKEVEALRAGVKRIGDQEATQVYFDQKAAALLAAGKVREALDELERLAALHPDEPLHRGQLSDALVEAGFGEAAREQARKGVELDPLSAYAHRKLAWALLHDELGRMFHKGFDYAGALSAFDRAATLEPDSFMVRRNLAILYEYDPDGRRWTSGAQLNKAIAEYRAIRKDLERKDLDESLLNDLLRAGRLKELKDAAEQADAGSARNAFLLAAVAALQGAPAALAEARRQGLSGDVRREALNDAADKLVHLRRYPEAAALVAEASAGAKNEVDLRARAELLSKTRRKELLRLRTSEPAGAIQKLFMALFTDSQDPAELRELLSPTAFPGEAAQFKLAFQAGVAPVRRALMSTGAPLPSVLDIALSNLQLKADGDDKLGWRISAYLPAAPRTATWFVAKEDGRYRLVGAADAPWTLALQALRRAQAGDLAGARRWLSWLEEPPLTDPKALGAPGAKEAIEFASALLLAFGDRPELAVEVLERSRTWLAAEQRKQADWALAAASLKLEKYDALLEAATRLLAEGERGSKAFELKGLALRKLDRAAELKAEVEARLAADPEDEAALETLLTLGEEAGDFEAGIAAGRRLDEAGRANAHVLNELAWMSLFVEKDLDRALEDARRACDLSGWQNPALIHTLASLSAAVGKPAEARQLLLRAIEAAGGEPHGADWYVVGRIAEDYGLRDEASRAYRRLEPPKQAHPADTYWLAKRRLDALLAPATEAKAP